MLQSRAIISLVLIAGGFGVSWSAFAASAFASSAVDWTSLSIIHSGDGSVVFDPVETGNLLNASSATAGANSDQRTSLIWTKGSFATASEADGDNLAYATAFTPAASSGFVHTHSNSESSSVMFTSGTLAAASNDLRAGLFTVHDSANVGFQLAYELFVSALGNDPLASANGVAAVAITVWNLSSAGNPSSVRSAVLETFFDGNAFVDGNRGRVNLPGGRPVFPGWRSRPD